MSNINQRLNGLDPLAYAGTNALQPTDFRTKTTDPTVNDSKNFYLGTWWLNTTTLALWYLAALVGNQATWLRVTLNGASTFEGNAGGPVAPDNTGLLHVVGDGVTVNVVGNPATNTLTISALGVGVTETLTGNSGGAVGPLAGNINVVGDGTTITIAGNPGTHTLTASTTGSVANSFLTDAGTAMPAAGVLTIHGTAGITTSGAGSTVTITGTGITFLHYTPVNTTPYVVLVTDDYLGVDSSGGAITIQLPNAPTTGRVFVIKDSTGSAAINNITVTTVGGAVNIDGATSFVMNTAYEAIEVIFNGTSYEIF